ncbi:hypothetical protein JCM10212_003505 [Sporobolomyces blumeae]
MQFPKARRFHSPPRSEVPGPGAYNPHSPDTQQYKKGPLGVLQSERFPATNEAKPDTFGLYNPDRAGDKENVAGGAKKRVASSSTSIDRERHRQQLEELKSRLTIQHEKELAKLQAKVSRLETSRDELVKDKAESGREVASLKSEIRHISSKLSKTESLLTKHQTSLPLLQAKMTSLQTSHEASRQRKETEIATLREKQEEVEQKLRDKSDACHELEEDLERERYARRQLVETSKAVVEDYETRLRSARVVELQQERYRSTRLERQLADRTAQVEALVEYSQQLEDHNHVLSRQVSDLERDAQDILDRWRQDRELLLDDRDEKEWRQRARSDQREIVGLGEEVEHAREVERVRIQVESAVEDVWRLRKREWKDEKAAMKREYEVVEGELDLAVNEEIPRLERLLSTANDNIASLESRLEEELSLVASLEADVQTLEARLSEDHERFEGELEEQKRVVKAKEGELEKERVDKRRVVGLLVQSRAAETALREQIDSLSSQIEVLQPLSLERANLQTTIDHLARLNAATEQDLQDLVDQNNELAGHSNQNQKIRHVASLREELIESKRKHLSTLSLLTAEQSRVKSLEQELLSYRAVPTSTSAAAPGRTGFAASNVGLGVGIGVGPVPGRSRVSRPDISDAVPSTSAAMQPVPSTTSARPDAVPRIVTSSTSASTNGPSRQPPQTTRFASSTSSVAFTPILEDDPPLLPPLLAKSASSFLQPQQARRPPAQQGPGRPAGEGNSLTVRDARTGSRKSSVGNGAERMLGRMSVSELFN